MEREPDYVYKCVVVGDYAVGKTSLISRFIQKKFLKEYKPTLGVNLILKELNITDTNGKEILVNLVLWDVAGQEKYDRVRQLYYKGCSAAMLVYDITRVETFQNLEKKWLKDFTENASKDALYMVVGNKADLEDMKKVSTEMGQELSDRITAISFIETSAKDGTNVDEAFLDLIKKLLEQAGEYV
jgi:small GTP-binding protein